MPPGLAERLKAELTDLQPAGNLVRVYAPKARHWTSWLGGAILASQDRFSELWTTREEYEERVAKEAEAEDMATLGWRTGLLSGRRLASMELLSC